MFAQLSRGAAKVSLDADLPLDHLIQHGTNIPIEHSHGIWQLIAQDPFGHIVQTPPEFIAAIMKDFLIRRFHLPEIPPRFQAKGGSSIFVFQYHGWFSQIRDGQNLYGEVDAIAVRKKH